MHWRCWDRKIEVTWIPTAFMERLYQYEPFPAFFFFFKHDSVTIQDAWISPWSLWQPEKSRCYQSSPSLNITALGKLLWLLQTDFIIRNLTGLNCYGRFSVARVGKAIPEGSLEEEGFGPVCVFQRFEAEDGHLEARETLSKETKQERQEGSNLEPQGSRTSVFLKMNLRSVFCGCLHECPGHLGSLLCAFLWRSRGTRS